MRGILLLLVLVVGCGKTSFDGEADAQDSLDDHDGADTSCGDCDDRDPCTVDTCNPLTAECEHVPLDADEDSYAAIRSPDGTECGGDDCDDSDPNVYPGAPEVCLDGVDQDCDTVIDAFTAVTDEIILAGDDQNTINPAIVWTGSEFGVAWWNTGSREAPKAELYLTRIDARGSLIGEPTLANEHEDNTGPGYTVSMAWTGSEFGLTWNTPYDDGVSYLTFIEFSRVSAMGLKIGEDVAVAGDPTDLSSAYYSPTLVWTGSRYGIAYFSDSELHFSLLDSEGRRIGEDVRITSRPELGIEDNYPSLEWTGSGFGLTWSHGLYPLFDFYLAFTMLSPEGEKLIDDVIFDPEGGFYYSSIVWSGGMFAAAWSRFFAVFDVLGNPIADPIEIHGDLVYINIPQGLVWTGSEYGLIIKSGLGINEHYYYHVITSGGSEDREVLRISTKYINCHSSSAIAWTGSTIGAVWQNCKEDPASIDQGDIYYKLAGYCE
jgi:hypothetical protein